MSLKWNLILTSEMPTITSVIGQGETIQTLRYACLKTYSQCEMLHKPFSILKPQLYISSISWAFSSWEYSKRKFPTWIINHKFKYRVVSLSIIILLSGPIEQKISMLGLLALQGFVGFCKGRCIHCVSQWI